MVFGELVANEYQKYLGGQTIVMGSLRNNYYGVFNKQLEIKNTVLFISAFRENNRSKKLWKSFTIWTYVPKLVMFLVYKKIKKLLICAVRENLEEREWFKPIINKYPIDWQFLPKKESYSSYSAVEQSEIIFSVGGSTLDMKPLQGKENCFYKW